MQLGETSFGGAGIAQVMLPEAQRVTDREGKFDQISVAADGRRERRTSSRRMAQVMPRSVRVETGEEDAKRQSEDIADDLSFIKIALLVFAGVSLFVGAFLIFNTFSITVAQRMREFGLLRALGASRGAGAALGGRRGGHDRALGSALGIAGGIGVAAGINALFKSIGIDLPNTGTVVATRDGVVSLHRGPGRDAGVGAVAGAARHAGDADGGAARGRAAGGGRGAGSSRRSRSCSAWSGSRSAASACSAASRTRARRPA